MKGDESIEGVDQKACNTRKLRISLGWMNRVIGYPCNDRFPSGINCESVTKYDRCRCESVTKYDWCSVVTLLSQLRTTAAALSDSL